MNKIFIQALEMMKQMATDTAGNWQSSRAICAFHILGEVSAKLKVSIEGPLTLYSIDFEHAATPSARKIYVTSTHISQDNSHKYSNSISNNGVPFILLVQHV